MAGRKDKKTSPEETASLLSRLTFSWINNLILTGFKRPITDKDVWSVRERDKCKNLTEKASKIWKEEIQKCERRRKKCREIKNEEHLPKPSLTKVFIRSYGLYFFVGAIMNFISDLLLLSTPLILGRLIRFVKEKDDAPLNVGYIYSVALFIIMIAQSMFRQQFSKRASNTALRVKSLVISLVYRKIFQMNNTDRKSFSAGKIVNFASIDAEICSMFVINAFYLWSSPLYIITSLIMMYRIISWSAIIGFSFFVIILPINIYITKIEKRYRHLQMKQNDVRSKLTSELISGINIIKMYTWEESFVKKILNVRKKELKFMWYYKLYKCLLYVMVISAPFIVSVITFAAYVYLEGGLLTAEKAFVCISYFNLIKMPIENMPTVINLTIKYNVAIKRLTRFFITGEFDKNTKTQDDACESNDMFSGAIEITNGTFRWGDSSPVLNDINIRIEEGSFVAIVGRVGSGKSSLLSAILGEMNKTKGQVIKHGQLAYVAQQAWIRNQTLRDNILFTKPYQHEKYKNIIKACALEPDLLQLAMGDLTEIGEKGINLSGGQKQRVSLARAVYNDADVYLFDDPLSAVDSHVGKHIFENVLGPDGTLNKKTRVLVTNDVSILTQADNIIVLKDKHISEIGTYQELLEKGGDFEEMIKNCNENNSDCSSDSSASETSEDGILVEKLNEKEYLSGDSGTQTPDSASGYHYLTHDALIKLNSNHSPEPYFVNHYNLYNEIDSIPDEELFSGDEEVDENDGKIIKNEKTATGMIKGSVYLTYFLSIGLFVTFIILASAISQQAVLVGSRLWLVNWTSHVHQLNEENYYMIGYAMFGVGLIVVTFTLVFSVALASLFTSRKLHVQLLDTITHCPMSFFESNPKGRIINRFVKDMDALDELIPTFLRAFMKHSMTLLGILFSISYATPIFMVVLIPLLIAFIFIQRVYIATTRQLKRMLSVRCSPIFNHFFETIHGVSTIRAFEKQQEFTDDVYQRTDTMQEVFYAGFVCDRWLITRINILSSLVIFFASLFCVIQRDHLSPGMAGLSISYSLQFTKALMNWVKKFSNLETNIVAVERIKEFIELKREAPHEIEATKPNDKWPSSGDISFNEYSVRYRPGLDLVLKNISFNIAANEKIGIVGRTGAGKSSITLALFRIIEPSGGSIRIDGIDISCIGLKDLRKKLCIIPQDPVLFTGSVRHNVDPLNEHSDEEVWHALEMSHLKGYVSSLKNGLQQDVVEGGGDSLSVGQRQLICLARAILRNSKILILDEATAAIDMETDSYIQQTIRNEFKECTVLTIAHRLHTILDYDRILVLQGGQVVEFDKPDILLANENSIFYDMVKASSFTSTTKSDE